MVSQISVAIKTEELQQLVSRRITGSALWFADNCNMLPWRIVKLGEFNIEQHMKLSPVYF